MKNIKDNLSEEAKKLLDLANDKKDTSIQSNDLMDIGDTFINAIFYQISTEFYFKNISEMKKYIHEDSAATTASKVADVVTNMILEDSDTFPNKQAELLISKLFPELETIAETFFLNVWESTKEVRSSLRKLLKEINKDVKI